MVGLIICLLMLLRTIGWTYKKKIKNHFDQLILLIYLKGKQRGEEKSDQEGSGPSFLGVCSLISVCSLLTDNANPKTLNKIYMLKLCS